MTTNDQNPVMKVRSLAGATGTTSTGASGATTLALKTKKGVLAAAAYDESSSTSWGDLYKFIAGAQQIMVRGIQGFEKKGMIRLKQIAFATAMRELHDHVDVDQAVLLEPDVNYRPNGGTCLWHTAYTMVRDTEAQAAQLAAGGYSYNRVYLLATDLDGDTTSNQWGTTPDMARVEIEKALATGKADIFYIGVGGTSVQEHMRFAKMLGIPGECIYAVDNNTDPADLDRFARHHFGLFSAFLQSKSVAIAANQSGPTNLAAPGGAWKKQAQP